MNPNPISTNTVRIPAIVLIVIGSLNALLGIFGALASVLSVIDPNQQREVFKDSAEKFGFYIGQSAPGVVGFLSLVVSPIIIYGAVKMFNGSSLNWARVSAILAMIPFTSCCCLAGVPVGIWALIVLSQPETKLFFERGGSDYNPPPPPPPQYHQPM